MAPLLIPTTAHQRPGERIRRRPRPALDVRVAVPVPRVDHTLAPRHGLPPDPRHHLRRRLRNRQRLLKIDLRLDVGVGPGLGVARLRHDLLEPADERIILGSSRLRLVIRNCPAFVLSRLRCVRRRPNRPAMTSQRSAHGDSRKRSKSAAFRRPRFVAASVWEPKRPSVTGAFGCGIQSARSCTWTPN